MKKFLLSAAAAVFALVLGTGCAKEQSSISVDDIKGSAKIVGTLSYSQGTGHSSNKFTELVSPAANRKVWVKVPNNSLAPNGQATGFSTFETVTDENGKYEVVIPAVDQNGMTVHVQAESFEGTHTLVKSISGSNIEWDHRNVVFYHDDVNVAGVRPNDIKVANIAYGFQEVDADIDFPETVTFKVQVGQNGYARRTESDDFGNYNYFVTPLVSAYNGAAVVATVYYTDENGDQIEENGSQMVRKYAVTTSTDNTATTPSKSGYAVFNIPAKSADCQMNVEIDVLEYAQPNFVFYKREVDPTEGGFVVRSYPMSGIYTPYYGTGYKRITFSPLYHQILSVYMVFEPFATESNVTGGYNPYSENWADFTIE